VTEAYWDWLLIKLFVVILFREKLHAVPSEGLDIAKVTVAILIYFLLLCIKEIPIIGTTITPNPQSPNHIGLFASVSTM
jgi:hypothetical protein